MNGESLDIQQTKLNLLKQLFPEVFTEAKIDWEKLKAAFGDDINFNNERYVLNWAGKADAFKALQIPTTATLQPAPEESINFDTTENVFIEGENLEVLKVLQKSYYGKIKCIIIDPPYNTGSDSFIYPDSFKENKKDYEKRIGDKDQEGYLLKEGLFRKNSKDSGHFHSNWLSMMYPRLFLAKNLLQTEGVIFVCIDENEVHNLKLLMNEIFGEENYLTTINVKLRHEKRILKGDKDFHEVVEFVLLYKKNHGYSQPKIIVDNSSIDDYCFYVKELIADPEIRIMDGKEVGVFKPNEYLVTKESASITGLKKISIRGSLKEGNSSGRFYMKHLNLISEEYSYLFRVPDMGNDEQGFRYFLRPKSETQQNGDYFQGIPKDKSDEKEVPYSNFADFTNEFNNVGYEGGIEFRNGKKPIKYLQYLMEIGGVKLDKESIVMDFFAGSGSTGDAVIGLNEEDDGSRKFILVQLPEPCNETNEVFKQGFKTIAEISKERLRRVIAKIKKVKKEKPSFFQNDAVDLGFKVFKLRSSNFKIWQGDEINEENLVQQLDAFTNPVSEDSIEQNMLYELMLKAGYLLTDKVEAKNNYFSVNNGELVIALADISRQVIDEIIAAHPQKVITLDKLFKGNDQLKTNTVLQMKDAGIDFKTI